MSTSSRADRLLSASILQARWEDLTSSAQKRSAALMRVALADNRRCFIMLFSTDVVRYELSGPEGIEQAIRF